MSLARLANPRRLKAGRGSIALGQTQNGRPQPIADPELRSAIESAGGMINKGGIGVLPLQGDESNVDQALQRLNLNKAVRVSALNPQSRRTQAAAIVPREAITNVSDDYGTYEPQDTISITGPSNRQIEMPLAEFESQYAAMNGAQRNNVFHDDQVIRGSFLGNKYNDPYGPSEVEFERYTQDGKLTTYDPMLDKSLAPDVAKQQHVEMFGEAPATKSLSQMNNQLNSVLYRDQGSLSMNYPLGGGDNKRAASYATFGWTPTNKQTVGDYAGAQVLDTRRFNTVEEGMLMAAGDEMFNSDIAHAIRQSRRTQANLPRSVARRVESASGVDPRSIQPLPLAMYETRPDPYLERVSEPAIADARNARTNFFMNNRGEVSLNRNLDQLNGNVVAPVAVQAAPQSRPQGQTLSSAGLMDDDDLMAALFAM